MFPADEQKGEWSLGWRVYDFLFLAFGFAHGVNGLRQVLHDFITDGDTMRKVTWALFLFWAVISLIGAAAIVGGVGQP